MTPTDDNSQTVIVVGGDKPETVWVDESPTEIIAQIEQAGIDDINRRGEAMMANIGKALDVVAEHQDRKHQEWIERQRREGPVGGMAVPAPGAPTFELEREPGAPAAVAVADEPALVTDPNDRPAPPDSPVAEGGEPIQAALGKHARNHGGAPAAGADEPLSDAV